MSVRWLLPGLEFLAQRLDQIEKDRHQQSTTECSHDGATEHGDAQRLLPECTGATGKHQRQDAQDKRKGRHQDRPEPQPGGLYRRIVQRKPLVELQLGELHNQNGVLGRHGDKHHQGDLGKDVELVAGAVHARQEERQEGARKKIEIHIPPGPRLGDQVILADKLTKGFDPYKKQLSEVKATNAALSADVSNLQGTLAVASRVAFENGEPNKRDYRRYRIRDAGGARSGRCPSRSRWLLPSGASPRPSRR